MRDYSTNYIPDLTERYPEGFGGVDMCAPRDIEYEMWKALEEDYYRAEDYPEDESEQVISSVWDEMSDKKPLKRFKVGEEYESVCWFTAGIGYYTVKERNGVSSVTFSIGRHEVDGDHECEDETFPIKFDEDGNEYITLYVYGDHENNIRAGYDGYGNEIY